MEPETDGQPDEAGPEVVEEGELSEPKFSTPHIEAMKELNALATLVADRDGEGE